MKHRMTWKGEKAVHFLKEGIETSVDVEFLDFKNTTKMFAIITDVKNPKLVCTIPFDANDFNYVLFIFLDKIEVVKNDKVIDTFFMYNTDQFFNQNYEHPFDTTLPTGSQFKVTKDVRISYKKYEEELSVPTKYLTHIFEYENAFADYLGTARDYNYEAHITVEVNSQNDIDRFKKVCEDMLVKHIIINLGDEIPKQVMTSHTFRTNSLESAIENVKAYSKYLQDEGFTILREKIETEPKCIEANDMPYHYAEIHLLYKTEDLEGKDLPPELHKSSNEFKKGFTFLTYRTQTKEIVSEFQNFFHDYPHVKRWINRMEIEYAVYDTNIDLDKAWMS